MEISRRQFGALAGLSAAGFALPGRLAQAKTNEKELTRQFTAPPAGKNIHPLLAKRDQQAILGRIQSLMKRDGIGALIVVK
ncbi:TPA: hypothetical protein ACVU41_001873, partial [Vibrio parahaemolyticus]